MYIAAATTKNLGVGQVLFITQVDRGNNATGVIASSLVAAFEIDILHIFLLRMFLELVRLKVFQHLAIPSVLVESKITVTLR